MSIQLNNFHISNVIISSFGGRSGRGIFPFTFWPPYRELMRVVRRTNTTSLTKSSTHEKHAGNFIPHKPWTWRCIQRLKGDGLVNAYGLTNPGSLANALGISRAIRIGFNVVPSFYPRFAKGQAVAIEETLRAIETYAHQLGKWFWALEFNFSCPNAAEEIQKNTEDALACVKAIRRACPDLCLIAKISIAHPYKFAQEIAGAGVDVIHAINTIPYRLVYPDRLSPLADVGGGGVSGGPAFEQAFRYNLGLRRLISVPMIMGCGVMDLANARAYFGAGANAVSLCTVCRLYPRRAIRIIEEYAT